MVALASREVRRLVYHRLWLWGEYLKHGYLPGQGDGIASGNKPGSRLPCPHWYLDLCRAFASLSPTTRGLADEGNTAWLAHAPLNNLQLAVWSYYVDGLGGEVAVDTARAERRQWQHERDREIAKAVKQRDWRGDELVAARLHCSARTAHRYRTEAVWAMAELVRWDDDLDTGSLCA